jgi:hypothetical protein
MIGDDVVRDDRLNDAISRIAHVRCAVADAAAM